jgi:predicted phage terminase large subunit-like protein
VTDVVRLQLPEPMAAFLEPRRHKVARGGRGSTKSWSIARLLVVRGTARRQRWLCCREHQKSIKESSHRLLASQIRKLGLSHLWDVQRDVIKGPHDSEFIFAGLKDLTADSLKSLEDLDGAWVEEAHTVSSSSANILIPTVRNPGSEIWWSYNPDQEDDYVHVMAESGAPDVLVVTMNWDANPWFPPELDAERIKLKAINDDLYQHIWEGKCRSAQGLLFKRRWFKRYEPGQEPAVLNKYLASDYAGEPDEDAPEREPDWTEHGVFGLDQKEEIWIPDWWSGQESPDTWIAGWLALARRHKPLTAFEEKGVILRTLNGAINKAMRTTGTYVHRHGLASTGAKYERALAFAALAATGIVHIPNTEWGDRLVNQLCAFNGRDGRVDDMVDACSKFAQALDEVIGAASPPPPKPPSPEPFTEAWFNARDGVDEQSDAERQRYYR